MHKTNLILDHWKKEEKTLSKNLILLRQKLSKEAIHDLRVAIKKLRAYQELFFVLQKETERIPGETETYFHKTESLFNILGRQRDVEICLELTDILKKEDEYVCPQLTIFLQAVLKMAKAWSNQEIHRYRKNELLKIGFLLKQEQSLKDSPALNLKIISAIDKMLEKLTSHFRQPHQLRMTLKTVYYWVSLLANKENYQPELLHSILDDLGSWQDHEVLSLRLKHFRKDYLPKPFEEYAVVKEMEALTNEKKKSLVLSARNKTKRWLKAIQ